MNMIHRLTTNSPIGMSAIYLAIVMMLVPPAYSQSRQDRLPVLYGFKIEASRVVIDVTSSGCTDASYYSVQLDAAGDVYHLSIVALKQDRCRTAPHIISLALDMPAVSNATDARFLLL